MKKILLSFAVLLMGTTLFTACSDDDDDPKPQPVFVNTLDGMFVVGSGNTRSNIDGNLTYIDYVNHTSTSNAFQAANGQSLGKTANYAMVYGGKLYIAVDRENTIWVCDRNTLKVQKQINTTKLLGETDGISPRAMTGFDNMVFFTCYGTDGNGIVAAVDTLNFDVQKTYRVGSYPDGLTVAGRFLFVANSDYGNNQNPSISCIDLYNDKVTDIKDEAITNPMQMGTLVLNGTADAYFLDYGTYDASWNQTGAGVRRVSQDGTVTRVVDGTAMCVDQKNGRILTVNAPYGGDGTNYLIYNAATGAVSSWEPQGIISPAVIAADPVDGQVFIISYNLNPDTGYPAYDMPTFAVQYDVNGNKVSTYDCGVGPISVAFNVGLKTVYE